LKVIMQQGRKRVTPISATNRSRVTNGTELLRNIDGRSPLARRFRDVLRGLLVEFDVDTEAGHILLRQATFLTLLSEQLQTRIVNGEIIDTRVVVNLAGGLRRTLAALRQRTGQRGPAPPSIHQRMAEFGQTLDFDPDDYEDDNEREDAAEDAAEEAAEKAAEDVHTADEGAD
jgi:hypothetical protein